MGAERLSLVLSLALAGCIEKVGDPPAPNVNPLLTAYDNPTGQLTSQSLEQVVKQAQRNFSRHQATGGLDMVTNTVDNTSAKILEDGEATDGNGHSVLRSVASIQYVCTGLGDKPTVDADENGVLNLTLKATERGLFPVVWGEFQQCQQRITAGGVTKNVILDGSITYYVGKQSGNTVSLYAFDGSLTVDGMTTSGSYDVRVIRAQDETLVTVNGQTFVVGVDADNGNLLIQDSTDEWNCDPTTLVCTSETDGQTVSATGGSQ